MSLDPFSLIDRASLSGFPLMLALLAGFATGAIAVRLALTEDARALWRVIRREASEPEEREE